MKRQSHISVVIPTYNRRDSLKRTLQSLVRQDYDPSLFEVVIADTGSTDGTPEMVSEFKPPFAVRRLPLPKRYAFDAPIARNAGADSAEGEILIFIDSDIVVPQHFIREHVSCHESVSHAFVGGAVCHAFNMRREDPASDGSWAPDLCGMLAPYQAAMLEFSGNLASCRFPWSYCYGANYSMAREDFVAHALRADETFAERGLAASDTELSYRAYLAGLRILFSRFAVAYHDLGTTPTLNSSERTDRVMKGLEYVASKHPSSESDQYLIFRSRDCEEFLQTLLRGSQSGVVPVLVHQEWLAWMEKILGSVTPSVSILVFTKGNVSLVEKILLTLEQYRTQQNDFEVLIFDSAASGCLGSSRTGKTLDLSVQTLKTNFCLRYYPVADIDAGIAHIAIGGNSCYTHLQHLNRNLSRAGWYFTVLNHNLYGRIRGRLLILIDDSEALAPDLLAQRIERAAKQPLPRNGSDPNG